MGYPSANIDDWVVMLVDDHPDNVHIAVQALTYHGAKVYAANNGREGLTLLEQYNLSPTLFLLDLQMPVMNGWQMFDHLRGDSRYRAVPIVAITAHAMDGDEEKVLEYGFDGYISKPYDVITLVERLQAIISHR